jgi:hypothetical protein
VAEKTLDETSRTTQMSEVHRNIRGCPVVKEVVLAAVYAFSPRT